MPRRRGSSAEVSDERKERIVALFNSKNRPTLEEIAQLLGITRQYVSYTLREAGYSPQEMEGEEVSGLVEEICEVAGWTKADISLILGVTRGMVTRWAQGQKASPLNARRLQLLVEGLHEAALPRSESQAG